MTANFWVSTTALVILAAATASAQQVIHKRCGYMKEIPRPDSGPELPDQNFDGLPWAERPLLPAEDRPEVCMDDFTLDLHLPMGYQVIYMEEEIEGDVVIAKLNYKGTEPPTLGIFYVGTFSMLVPALRRIPANTGEWHLVITNRQDFETPGMQFYMFEVRAPGEALVAVVDLHIVNIDDNAPIIQLTGPCEIPENKETGVPTCEYVVYDADGEISTRDMYFTIDSDRGDERVFDLVRENHTSIVEGTGNVVTDLFRVNMVMALKESLNFEENPLHIFRVTAFDSLPNNHTISMMVEVGNVEQRPPRWVEIFAVQQFDEKVKRSFRIRAIDGDTGINKPIHYRLITQEIDKDLDLFEIETKEGGHDGAILHVGPIDRDTLMREVFYVTIVAYKYGDDDEEGSPSFETPADIVIIINDVNDNAPLPRREDLTYTIDIPEETAMTLNLENFGFHDRDLGPNAQYTMHLESVYPEGAHRAFYIAPEVGYQNQSFIIGTLNHSMLDYEAEIKTGVRFQKIQLQAKAIDMNNNSWVGVATININLINWNDELPSFKQDVWTASFPETVGEEYHVGRFLATDLDVDDRLEYSLLGNAVNFLRIDKDTADIYVTVNDTFNYHRQNELFVQIRVDDTLGDGPHNSATSQLVIQLQDINNTPPTLRLPRGSPHVEENVPEGKEITREVTATDPDTTADLVFEIDWDSSYATKQGRETPAIEFHNCIHIETKYHDESRRGSAYGVVEVRQIREGVTIDYEEFEVLYLTVRVRDRNTVIGDDYDESTLTITIIDMNDEEPVWGEGQLEQLFRVREVSPSGVVIGSVFATDRDGPLYNQVRYTIQPKEGTPPDLVTIGFVTGQITVQKDQAIDADEPPRDNLYYTVIASDQCSMDNQTECPPDKHFHETKGDLTIQILDTNNKVPVLDKKTLKVVEIYEDAVSGDDVMRIVASDLDRDLPNSNVSYQINYRVNQRLLDFFAVDLVSGMIFVNYTGTDVLDRDGDEPTHTIFYNVIDNFLFEGDINRNMIEGELLVVLLDVNDNAPEMPEPNFPHWTISENLLQGVRIEPDIFARDIDEPGHPNSKVAYGILELEVTNRDIEVPDLFEMITIETDRGIDQTGELKTLQDLRGYWGTYKINITAFDHGVPQQRSNETYELIIRPYNYHAPQFVFPHLGSTIRLSRERAVVGGILALPGLAGAPLDSISATDEDGLHAGTVTFSVVGDNEAASYFDIWNDGENSGTLTLKQALPEGFQQFQLTIRATDGGTEPGPRSTDITVTVAFIQQGDPVFAVNTETASFVELDESSTERHELTPAEDPKNRLCTDDCYAIYYSIIEGNAEGHFALDGNVLYVVRALNRDERETHTLLVAASNTRDVTSAPPASTVTVTVTVREADPRPRFSRPLYTAGISTSDVVGRELLTAQATHSDGLAITYAINLDSMVVDPSLEAVRDEAFTIDSETGLLVLRIQPTASMHGMFEFDVVATDTNKAEGHSEVKVYLISSRNRVYFVFDNAQDAVMAHRTLIAETVSLATGLTCNIDETLPVTDANGIASEIQTEVRAHFIHDDLPVPVEEVNELLTDSNILQDIRLRLRGEDLHLVGVQAGGPLVLAGGDHALAVYILAGVAALLALLCLVLLITFILRNRALNRRIAALSMTKYSSVESNLNRLGLAAPGTNKHAVEGSNPIWNETIKAPDFDAISELSNDSDLIGIEDLPQFRNDYFPAEDDRSTRDLGTDEVTSTRNPIANHENNFGFNTTPFSPEFANTQFRR